MLAMALSAFLLLLFARPVVLQLVQNTLQPTQCTCDQTSSSTVQNAMPAYNYWSQAVGMNTTAMCSSNGQCETAIGLATNSPNYDPTQQGTGLCARVAIAGTSNLYRFCTGPLAIYSNVTTMSQCMTSSSGYTFCICNTQNFCNAATKVTVGGSFVTAIVLALFSVSFGSS